MDFVIEIEIENGQLVIFCIFSVGCTSVVHSSHSLSLSLSLSLSFSLFLSLSRAQHAPLSLSLASLSSTHLPPPLCPQPPPLIYFKQAGRINSPSPNQSLSVFFYSSHSLTLSPSHPLLMSLWLRLPRSSSGRLTGLGQKVRLGRTPSLFPVRVLKAQHPLPFGGAPSVPSSLLSSSPSSTSLPAPHPNFLDHKEAYGYKTTFELLTSLLVFKLCSFPSFVKNGPVLLEWSKK